MMVNPAFQVTITNKNNRMTCKDQASEKGVFSPLFFADFFLHHHHTIMIDDDDDVLTTISSFFDKLAVNQIKYIL